MNKQKLLDLINKFTPANDKLQHFFWGSVLTLIGTLLYFLTGYLFFIYTPALFAGAIKELTDKQPSFWDFVYTSIPGILIGILILYTL